MTLAWKVYAPGVRQRHSSAHGQSLVHSHHTYYGTQYRGHSWSSQQRPCSTHCSSEAIAGPCAPAWRMPSELALKHGRLTHGAAHGVPLPAQPLAYAGRVVVVQAGQRLDLVAGCKIVQADAARLTLLLLLLLFADLPAACATASRLRCPTCEPCMVTPQLCCSSRHTQAQT